ncbi:zinc finger protein 37-like [Pseudophryne corroboree]|uniref:zinc finger protein 37-like n=1 Tax=Pseudophryne corroboree TaxID=495146 RepID=UPI0030819117
MMEKDRIQKTEMIINISLEIIYLLTGEDYTVVKKTSGEYETSSIHPLVSGGLSRTHSPITVPPPHSLIHERYNDQKILDLTNKIIQLLTGEEGEYIEEQKGLYKDVMMENHRTLTSLGSAETSRRRWWRGSWIPERGRRRGQEWRDGPSNRDTPERCSRPLYSQDCTEENRRTPQEDQCEVLTRIKVEDTEREEETCMSDMKAEDTEGEEETCMSDMKAEDIEGEEETYVTDMKAEDIEGEEETYVSDMKAEDTEGEEETYVTRMKAEYKEGEEETYVTRMKTEDTEGDVEMYMMGDQPCKEEIPTYVSTYGPSNRNTPQRRPRPRTQKNHRIAHQYEVTDLCDIKVKVLEVEEDMYATGDQQEEIPSYIGTDGNTSRNVSEKNLIVSPGFDITRVSHGQNPNIHPVPNSSHMSDPSSRGEYFPDYTDIGTDVALTVDALFSSMDGSKGLTRQSAKGDDKPFSCAECGKCFTHKSNLVEHYKYHTGEGLFSCTVCGKCFTKKSHFVEHLRIHTGEKPFKCTECGKCFTTKSHVVLHQRRHTGDKPFPCSECRKSFATKDELVVHERMHAGAQPFSSSEYGNCFTQKLDLVTHETSHTNNTAFLCSECGIWFTTKSELVTHQKTHTPDTAFLCFECGKCFTSKSGLVTHQRTHASEKPFSCSECGKCFKHKSNLVEHYKYHTGEGLFTCYVCGKCFPKKSHFLEHQRIHTGEKPFACSECGRRFTTKSHLVIHLRSHTTEKPVTSSV